jgi:tetratricopeptide (TPR) repeat protein
MRSLILSLLFFSCTATSFTTWADEISAKENWFEQGLRAYQTKNWDQARDNFEKALQFQPNEAAILYNLGLAYFQMNKKGYAVGYWRKALALAPSLHGPAAALDQIEERFHFSRLEKSPWAIALHDLFLRIGWDLWLGTSAAFTALAGWLWLSFLQRRKSALASEDEETPSAGLGLVLATFAFTVAWSGNFGKWLDEQKIRGTVVTTSAELKSAPTNDGVTLAPLPEAAEVLIVRAHEDWLQVNTGEGGGGWVKKTDVLPASKDL